MAGSLWAEAQQHSGTCLSVLMKAALVPVAPAQAGTWGEAEKDAVGIVALLTGPYALACHRAHPLGLGTS